MAGRTWIAVFAVLLVAALAPGPVAAGGEARSGGAHAAKKSKKKCKRAASSAKKPKKSKKCKGGSAATPAAPEGGLLPPDHAVEISPAALDFGVVGQTNLTSSRVFTVTNTGTQPTGPLTDDVYEGSDLSRSAFFSRGADTCMQPAPVSLPPGGTCTIEVKFTNNAFDVEIVRSSVVINDFDNGVGMPATISALAAGSGPPPAELTINHGSHDFGDFVVGTDPPRTFTFTIINAGQSSTGVLAVDLVNEDPLDPAFTIEPGDDHCAGSPKVLIGGSQCTVKVTFDPSTAGAEWSGSLNVTANPGGDVSADLSGSSST